MELQEPAAILPGLMPSLPMKIMLVELQERSEGFRKKKLFFHLLEIGFRFLSCPFRRLVHIPIELHCFFLFNLAFLFI